MTPLAASSNPVVREPSGKVNLAYLVPICLVATIGGLLFGYDTGVISGAIEPMTVKFGLAKVPSGAGCSMTPTRGCLYTARVATLGDIDVYLKNLEDGGKAVAFFNRGPQAEIIDFCKLGFIGISGPQHVRDLWRQKNLPDVTDPKDAFKVNIAAHSAEL